MRAPNQSPRSCSRIGASSSRWQIDTDWPFSNRPAQRQRLLTRISKQAAGKASSDNIDRIAYLTRDIPASKSGIARRKRAPADRRADA